MKVCFPIGSLEEKSYKDTEFVKEVRRKKSCLDGLMPCIDIIHTISSEAIFESPVALRRCEDGR